MYHAKKTHTARHATDEEDLLGETFIEIANPNLVSQDGDTALGCGGRDRDEVVL